MPNISLLEPTVLRDVVQKIPPAQDKILLNSVPSTTVPVPFYEWEITRGSRSMARPNVPNAEAHIVPRMGTAKQSASLVYLREKKVFQPTTTMWLRAPGSLTAVANAEQAVVKELNDLVTRADNFWEWTLWQALQGSLVIDSADVVANPIDYGISSSHKPTASTSWATATPQQIIANITAWKNLILRDGNVNANKAYLTTATLGYIVNAFVNNGINLMTDAMKDQYFRTGTITGFLGIDWTTVDTVYDIRQADNSYVQSAFLPNNTVIFGDFTTNRPLEMVKGPSADFSAPQGFTGRFTKSWEEPDPSGRQVLLEEHALPIITRPEQFVIATVA